MKVAKTLIIIAILAAVVSWPSVSEMKSSKPLRIACWNSGGGGGV